MTTSTVVHTKDRLSGVVQAVGRRPSDVPRRWWESFLVFLLFTVAYTWFGHWVVVDTHVVGFETLDRLNRALMVWHNDPAKLSAIGFDYPPLATLLIAPLAIFRGFVTSMSVVPLASAMFAGITMVAFNTMMRRAMVGAPLRYAVLLALGANPMVLLYATTGTRHFVWIAFLITGLGSLFAWYITADVRFVMLAGIAYALSALSGYSSLTFFLLSAIMIGAILARLGADGTEVEGTVVGFGAPTIYVIALWTVFNMILLGRPFAWITRSSDAAASGGLEQFSGVELLRATGELVLYGAPIAIIVLPALIFAGLARGNPFALWLGVLLGAAILMPALAVALRLTDSPMLMRNALPILLIAVVGAIWLARSADEGSTLVAALLVVGLVLSIPWTLNEMKSYRYQNLEAPFAAAVTTGESQEGAETLNREKVGIVSEQAMAEYIKNNVTRDNSILTDNAQTYAVMLLTGHPEYFYDRIDQSDGPWKDAARNPAEHVDYLLMSTADNGDLLTTLYADAATGSDPQLQVVYRTPRYVLVGVPADYTPGTETTTTTETADLSVDTEKLVMSDDPRGQIAPPPSVDDVLSSLTDDSRIGMVDFTAALAAAPAPERREPPPPAPVIDEAEIEPEAEIVEPVPVPEPAPEVAPVIQRDVTWVVEEVAESVIARMHAAEQAVLRHIEAMEVEATRRYELMTAQAELDAELIRLQSRREAHAIVSATRMRAGEIDDAHEDIDTEGHRLSVFSDAVARVADFTELSLASARARRDGPN